jgi:SagB-type dehydrogenase family enzyme
MIKRMRGRSKQSSEESHAPADSREIVLAYHERTKHHFNRYAEALGYMDWETQPYPFRHYEGAPRVDLPFGVMEDHTPYADLYRSGAIPAADLTLQSVGSFLYFSMALSAWKEVPGSRWSLRVNPSSGNLHPTEAYLVLPGLEDLGPGLAVYHYHPLDHSLERRADFAELVALDDRSDSLGGIGREDASRGPLFLVSLTSIHWREAWKYGERAYRYCQHDCGHAIAALSLSAALHGWRLSLIEAPSDDQHARLIGVDRFAEFHEAEREAPEALFAVHAGAPGPVAIDHLLSGAKEAQWLGRANTLSTDHHSWEVIDAVDAASRKPVTPPPGDCIEVEADESTPVASSDEYQPGVSARQVVRQRRSAVAMDRQSTLSSQQFFAVLERVMPRPGRPPFNTFPAFPSVHLALFVHRVVGLSPGLYFLLRDAAKAAELRDLMSDEFSWHTPPACPERLPLFVLREGDCKGAAAQVSCGQEIAADGAFSLGMLAEFSGPIARYGAWHYRRIFWETGVIGQVLYLEAEAVGLRSTGIGCFFDDPMHALLGLTDNRYQSLYHFTVGGAVDDHRLTTKPGYEPRA